MQVLTHEIETLIGERYQVLRPLAEGGMGTVYLARQLGLNRLVAIKTLCRRLPGQPDLVKRFRREASAVQRLTHPNTVRVYDFGDSGTGLVYLVMEYIQGETLEAALGRMGRFPAEAVVRIGRQVLKSLLEAHSLGVIRRDIKPSNLMLCNQVGESDFVKVLDFGLASLTAETDSGTLTGQAMGTPHYMSPEQVRGQPVDARSDLYSLGLTLYELVVGQPAYDGASIYAIALNHVTDTPLVLPDSLLGTNLGRVIARATQKAPAARYASAREMLQDLTGEVLAESSPALLEFVPDTGDFAQLEPVAPTQSLLAPLPSSAIRAGRWAQAHALALFTITSAAALLAVGLSPEGPDPIASALLGRSAPAPTAQVAPPHTPTPLSNEPSEGAIDLSHPARLHLMLAQTAGSQTGEGALDPERSTDSFGKDAPIGTRVGAREGNPAALSPPEGVGSPPEDPDTSRRHRRRSARTQDASETSTDPSAGEMPGTGADAQGRERPARTTEIPVNF